MSDHHYVNAPAKPSFRLLNRASPASLVQRRMLTRPLHCRARTRTPWRPCQAGLLDISTAIVGSTVSEVQQSWPKAEHCSSLTKPHYDQIRRYHRQHLWLRTLLCPRPRHLPKAFGAATFRVATEWLLLRSPGSLCRPSS